jgi:hypothetical protein
MATREEGRARPAVGLLWIVQMSLTSGRAGLKLTLLPQGARCLLASAWYA